MRTTARTARYEKNSGRLGCGLGLGAQTADVVAAGALGHEILASHNKRISSARSSRNAAAKRSIPSRRTARAIARGRQPTVESARRRTRIYRARRTPPGRVTMTLNRP
jgi:hypothetical protein